MPPHVLGFGNVCANCISVRKPEYWQRNVKMHNLNLHLDRPHSQLQIGLNLAFAVWDKRTADRLYDESSTIHLSSLHQSGTICKLRTSVTVSLHDCMYNCLKHESDQIGHEAEQMVMNYQQCKFGPRDGPSQTTTSKQHKDNVMTLRNPKNASHRRRQLFEINMNKKWCDVENSNTYAHTRVHTQPHHLTCRLSSRRTQTEPRTCWTTTKLRHTLSKDP